MIDSATVVEETLRTIHPDGLEALTRAFGGTDGLKAAIVRTYQRVCQLEGVKQAINTTRQNGGTVRVRRGNAHYSGVRVDAVTQPQYSPWVKARAFTPECRWPLVIPVARAIVD